MILSVASDFLASWVWWMCWVDLMCCWIEAREARRRGTGAVVERWMWYDSVRDGTGWIVVVADVHVRAAGGNTASEPLLRDGAVREGGNRRAWSFSGAAARMLVLMTMMHER